MSGSRDDGEDMKIYRRKEFLDLPEGTIYAKGKRWYFDGLRIKGESYPNDWRYLDPMWIDAQDSGEAFERLEEMLETGASYPMEEATSRDGLFDGEDIFLVAERADLEKLRAMIDTALNERAPETCPEGS